MRIRRWLAWMLMAGWSGQISADDAAKRPESLGPLMRHDPNADRIEEIIAIHGKPRLGLPGGLGSMLHRRAEGDRWYVGGGGGLTLLELDRESVAITVVETIKLRHGWSFSPDGSKLFGGRDRAWGRTFECFDMATNQPLWAAEEHELTMASRFSPDGKTVIVLHSQERDFSEPPEPPSESSDPEDGAPAHLPQMQPNEARSAVSWYDVESGERVRRVELPGTMRCIMDSSWNYLEVAEGVVYVIRPTETSHLAYMIREDSKTPVPVETFDQYDSSQGVRAGGESGEFVAFYSNQAVILYRREGEDLKRVHEIPTPDPAPGFRGSRPDNHVRFSPGGKFMSVFSPGWHLVVDTSGAGAPVQARHDFGTRLGDFTPDGKYMVFFHEGGGTVYETERWTPMIDEKKKTAGLCCPLTEVGFSAKGNLILSCEAQQLLLWAADGRLLAELASPRKKEKDACVEMQSALISEQDQKVYAADGWDFLEWDLGEIAKKVRTGSKDVPVIEGKVAFGEAPRKLRYPELMTLHLNSKGKGLVTATNAGVRYRESAGSPTFTSVSYVEGELRWRPRSFQFSGDPARLVMKAGSGSYRVDPGGVEPGAVVSHNVHAIAADVGTHFVVESSRKAMSLRGISLEQDESSRETMELPESWTGLNSDALLVTPDAKWIIATPRIDDGPALAVIDWEKKEVTWSRKLRWEPRAVALSEDRTRLAVGGFNRAIYIFDFTRMSGGED